MQPIINSSRHFLCIPNDFLFIIVQISYIIQKKIQSFVNI